MAEQPAEKLYPPKVEAALDELDKLIGWAADAFDVDHSDLDPIRTAIDVEDSAPTVLQVEKAMNLAKDAEQYAGQLYHALCVLRMALKTSGSKDKETTT